MIAFHDPPVVRVGNFQSSTLLIIGIYPSRYHENKFSLFRSTGKKEEEAATSYTRMLLRSSLLLLMMVMPLMRTTVVLPLPLLFCTPQNLLRCMLLYLLLWLNGIFFFAHVILLTFHSHWQRWQQTTRRWSKRRFCCRATEIYRELPQL